MEKTKREMALDNDICKAIDELKKLASEIAIRIKIEEKNGAMPKREKVWLLRVEKTLATLDYHPTKHGDYTYQD